MRYIVTFSILLSFSFTSKVTAQESKASCFIEFINIDPDFEFYSLKASTFGKTSEERSDHLNATHFENLIWEYIAEYDLYVDYDERTDKTTYVRIDLQHFNAKVKTPSIGFITEATINGEIKITDHLGKIHFRDSLESAPFVITKSLQIYDRHSIRWTNTFENTFADELAEELVKKISEYIQTKTLPDAVVENNQKLVPFKSDDNSFGALDEKCNSNILGIVSRNGISSATLLGAEGHFVCDYKMVYDLPKIKVIDAKGDTINASLVSTNKSWDLALCKLEAPVKGYNYQPVASIKVGDEVFIRGITGVKGLPVLCADGEIIAKFEQEEKPVYVTNAGFSSNFSGAPILNREGKLFGIAMINGRERGEQTFVCLPLNLIYSLLNLNQNN
jgi:hypothetical protein